MRAGGFLMTSENNIDDDDDDASRETHRQRNRRAESVAAMGRKSFRRGALLRSRRAVPRHCLTYDGGGEHNAPRRGPARVLGALREKGGRTYEGRKREREEKRVVSGRFAVSASATERQKVRPLPNDLSVFVSRLIYE